MRRPALSPVIVTLDLLAVVLAIGEVMWHARPDGSTLLYVFADGMDI